MSMSSSSVEYSLTERNMIYLRSDFFYFSAYVIFYTAVRCSSIKVTHATDVPM